MKGSHHEDGEECASKGSESFGSRRTKNCSRQKNPGLSTVGQMSVTKEAGESMEDKSGRSGKTRKTGLIPD